LLVLSNPLAIFSQNKIEQVIKQKAKKKYNAPIDIVSVGMIDTITFNGIYKIKYVDINKEVVEKSVIYINGNVYYQIRNKHGLGAGHTKAYYKLKKYLTEDQMKRVQGYFVRVYPPKI
ncbi:MAG: hypothetical protein ABUL44_04785, partial [Flavobacterium sp.]